jgi:hypothetical protein
MKPGDTIQIAQAEGVNTHWIYAKVILATPEGAVVEVTHPGNREDGRQKFVPAKETRAKTDVENLLAGISFPTDPQKEREQKENLRAQLDRLS